VIDSLRPYLFPNAHLEFISITFLGELVFMLWLLIRGWRIQEPTAPYDAVAAAAANSDK
jgi:hypothetical protein